MPLAPARSAPRSAALPLVGAAASVLVAGLGLMLVTVVTTPGPAGAPCAPAAGAAGAAGAAAALASGAADRVGATEYGGPGDPSSGAVGASGISLLAHPDSYAELGGSTFQTASAMGGLPYMTPVRVRWGTRSAIAYKRDFGLGGGPVAGLPRVIDLWWQFAGRLGIPYEDGRWSGPVTISAVAAGGAGNLLGASADATAAGAAPAISASSLVGAPVSAAAAGCPSDLAAGVPVIPGGQARLLGDGRAAAPANAPPAVRGIIAAGNQIAGKPYLYGGAHGLPLDEIAPAYDCSSSVEHLLYGGGLLPVGYGAASGALESFGRPGPGRWVTIYASAEHVFMYVAGLRWDTSNAAGPQDGSAGIGWHPLVRSAAGFVARHPAGL
ncbi:MAG TPA: hypothetical protein VFN87_00060 [Solirubrobacteraceae bacterium]|nr:hypothetical protein [Solirubrobacteraceae bacterium]